VPVIEGHKVSIADANQAIYNGFDDCMTLSVDDARRALRDNDELIYSFERGMQAPALNMMRRGFRVDIEEREKAVIQIGGKKKNTERVLFKIIESIYPDFTEKLPNSPKQLQHLFYDIMKLDPIERYEGGEIKRPMNRETLERLETRDIWASPIINGVLLDRDLTKALQVLETEIDPDWRWRCSYNIGGTSTGRWSSSKSPVGTGNNFQNISEEFRRVFIPDPGFKLYGIDKAQSEARDVGWFCGVILGDWSYLDACESGDLHTYVTRLLYPDWSWTGDLKRDKQIASRRFYRFFTYRDASKRLGHATNYYGRPKEISRQTRIPQHLCEEFQLRYFEAFPCIRRMHEWVAEHLQRDRYLINSFGRRRDFFDRPDIEETLKSAIAYMFQSATGDCLNLGLYRLYRKMGVGGPVQLLSQLHDAIYFQMPETSKKEEMDWLHEAIKCVEVTQKFVNREMTIPGEAVSGYNWAHRWRLCEDGSAEDWNKRGLDEVRFN
jgi:DNA polymerase I-like protein with 3'-5' exonuclease and polymerase domains